MRIDPSISAELTPPIVYLRGQFALWKFKIPYFSSVVPLKFAKEKFSLMEDIPDFERMEWSLQELFQRDISWNRVDQELVKYLRNENRPQFFNSLTVALLPKDSSGLLVEYESNTTYPPISDTSLEEPFQVGGIQIQSYKGSAELAGKIRWDVNAIVAVAVDGQHRLAAIKQAEQYAQKAQFEASSIPVIFLVPDISVGFGDPSQPDGENAGVSLRAPLRRIFIDLNKYARIVSRARNILLDDNAIVSVCTRSLIGKRLSDKEETDRVPLALVDWMTEKNKVDTGPFVTTILILHDLVEFALSPPNTTDLDSEDPKVRRWLIKTFKPNSSQLDELMSQVQRCFHRELPLTFLPENIEVLLRLFKQRWRPHLSRLFREITPYRALWDYGRKRGLHKPEFVNLYSARELFEGKRARERAERIKTAIEASNPDWNISNDYSKPLEHIEERIKDGNWAFLVVFQKGLFRSYIQVLDQFGSDEDEQREASTTRWLQAINALFDTKLAIPRATFSSKPKEEFWRGIGLRADSSIDFTVQGSKRIGRWLNVWVGMFWLDRIPSFSKVEEDDQQYSQMIWSSLRQRKMVLDGFERVVKARTTEDLTDEEFKEEALILMEQRYEYFRKLIKRIKSQK